MSTKKKKILKEKLQTTKDNHQDENIRQLYADVRKMKVDTKQEIWKKMGF